MTRLKKPKKQQRISDHTFEAIKRYLKEHPGSRTVEIAKVVGVSDGTIRIGLKKLTQQGLLDQAIRKHGNTFYRIYYLVNGLPPLESPKVQGPYYWVISEGDKVGFEKIPEYMLPDLERIKDGYGFYGILLYDPVLNQVQCHICGEWFIQLGLHSYYSHGTDADDYKAEFELGAVGLCTPDYANDSQRRAREMGLREMSKARPITEYKPGSHQPLRSILLMTSTRRHPSQRKVSSERALERFQNSKQYKRQCEILDQIRPLAVAATKGKPRSKEFRENLSRKLTGRKFSDEHRRRLSEYNRNRSPEHKEALQKARKESEDRRIVPQLKAILDYLSKHPQATFEQLGTSIGMTSKTASYRVQRLIREGKLKRIGSIKIVNGPKRFRYIVVEGNDENTT